MTSRASGSLLGAAPPESRRLLRAYNGAAMTSRASVSLLVAALAFLVLPLSGTAQAPRRPTTPLQAATRALVEGRFDEADAMADKLDVRDPGVAAIKARSAIARG